MLIFGHKNPFYWVLRWQNRKHIVHKQSLEPLLVINKDSIKFQMQLYHRSRHFKIRIMFDAVTKAKYFQIFLNHAIGHWDTYVDLFSISVSDVLKMCQNDTKSKSEMQAEGM